MARDRGYGARGERGVSRASWTPEDLSGRQATRHPPVHETSRNEPSSHSLEGQVTPYVALFEQGEMTDHLRNLEQRITENVLLARAAGVSWTQVGRAAGLSKQGAHQRWGQH